jgi:hypothetical protein
MASIINSTTTAGVTVTGDNSGSLQLATNNGTTAVTIDTSQRVAFVAGTAALPAITTTGDTNTGIFFPAADTIAFSEGGTESMRIDSSGNVGIGIASPTARLHVYGGSNNQFKVESSGAEANFTLAGTSYGQINNSVGDWYLTNDASANIIFRTASTERMRINSGGALLIGTTATSPATADAYGVTINSNTSGNFYAGIIQASSNGSASLLLNRGSDNGNVALFYRSAVNVGNIAVTTSSTAYNTSSDYRLKENIAPMTGALAVVGQLKPCIYTWKADGSSGQGFIAHELAEVVPDCVTGEKDAMETYTDEDGNEQTRINPQSVDTSFLVATLTAALQELNAKVDAQAAEIAALKAAP